MAKVRYCRFAPRQQPGFTRKNDIPKMAGRFSLVRKGYAEMDDTHEMIED